MIRDSIKEIFSVAILIFVIIAFIPLFQALGVNYSFIILLVIAIVIIILVFLILFFKEGFGRSR